MVAIDQMNARQGCNPEMGKFKTARCVWMPYIAWAGTGSSPSESRSIRERLSMKFHPGWKVENNSDYIGQVKNNQGSLVHDLDGDRCCQSMICMA
jgi:hypothetical protein